MDAFSGRAGFMNDNKGCSVEEANRGTGPKKSIPALT